jgi:RHS repeat-associated protein
LTAGSVSYTYDLDGFLTTKTDGSDVTNYTYSSRGELLSVNLPDGRTIEYIHDPLGRRIAKKVDGVFVEKYLWQGLTRLLAVYDGSDNLLMRFEYANSRVPVAVDAEGVTYYLTYDQVGSLRVVADSSGNVVKSTQYDSFGNILDDSNPSFEVPFGFAGGLHDRDTGLVRFGYRDFDPDIGRWTAKDPIGFSGGDTDLYGYVLNDPINFVDPDGLYTWPYTWKGWAGALLTGAGAAVASAGAIPLGVGLIAAGAGLTIWDFIEGINQAKTDTKASLREMIKERIDQAGGNAPWLQDKGLIPSNDKLRNFGFTESEIEELGLARNNSSCP